MQECISLLLSFLLKFSFCDVFTFHNICFNWWRKRSNLKVTSICTKRSAYSSLCPVILPPVRSIITAQSNGRSVTEHQWTTSLYVMYPKKENWLCVYTRGGHCWRLQRRILYGLVACMCTGDTKHKIELTTSVFQSLNPLMFGICSNIWNLFK